MMVQVTAVALLNEIKVLAHPASTDNVPTDGAKEDHVSMGMTAALKLRSIVENAELMLAIEMIAAAQGVEYRMPLQPGLGVQQAVQSVRRFVPSVASDRPMGPDIERLAEAIRGGVFDELLAAAIA
jgi:histidine ammonia-lyase